jgi:hypothetical protein
MRIARLIPVVAAGVLLAGPGCGGDRPKYVKVSGIVKLDGKPYKNALVSFQPLGTPDNPNPGHGSAGLTDEDGRFKLVTDDGYTGAVVGKHRVRIQTKRDDPTAFVDPALGSPDDLGPLNKKVQIDPIPVEWYSDKSTKEFTVPPGGTDQANFDITTTKAAPKK